MSVEPLTPVIGAEIRGVDLSGPLDEEALAAIRAAFTRHHVLVFRDQLLTPEAHKSFARRFGRLHVHPYHAANIAPEHVRSGGEADPELLEVKADRNSRNVAGEEWHTDVTCDGEPPLGSMLHLLTMPEGGGGDTCFISTIRAYETLSPAMQEIVKGLTALHDGAKLYTGYGTGVPEGGWPRATHPVVIRQKESGRLALFVNRGFTTRINEFSKPESDAFLEMLWRHIEGHVEFQCRVRWAENTLAFWDNRVTQHHSVWDYYPNSRFGRRVSIVGERPSQ